MSKTTMTGTDIRRSFLEHFAAKGHVIVPSSSLVPDNDPTLMFTNSGMVQFKNNFTGVDTRLKRAASSQRCVRAGGKHNDLENVGVTARHHTFFEMLGNFSFGDYFKKESLEWSWEWVTETLKLDPARICVTVYHDDDEAAAIWRKIGIADKDIIRIASSANFWTMGETGPCGPCSEIFYDLDPTGKQVTGGRPGTPEEDGDRWMEIWNNVFTQFDLQKDGTKVPLKNKNIDTGAGLERIMCAVQGVYSNYDTDVFQHLIGAAAKVAGTEYRHSAEAGDVSLRVIADHLRAMTFLMIDGVMPSNEGRGYVLRRIMRRAMRHGHLLGVEKPFINGLVPTLVGIMGDAYPELQRGAAMAMDVIKLEEERFGKTLKQGMALLNDATKALKKGDMLEGEVAFKLYDTYGFPLDLTQDALKDRGIGVNDDGFQNAMAEQKARARAAFKGSGDSKLSEVWFDVQEAAGKTEFLGYQVTQAEGVIKDLVADGKRVESLKKGQKGAIVVTQTPFYAESGGQVGDTGVINGDSWKFTVTDTQKVLDGVWVHHGEVSEGTVKIGANAELHVDEVRREAIMRNHSVTHLLNAALREILGTHVVQRGSRQDEFGTRFDISHPKGITPEELGRIERWVNERVWMNVPVVTRILPKEDAVQSGAVAQFGEKYGDEVRVVYMGNPDSTRLITADLCGGTHVGMTGEIGLFRITGESSVAAGIRRVEGVTHMRALESFNADAGIVKEVAALVKSKPAQIVERVTAIQKGAKAGAKAAGGSVDVAALLGKAEERGGFKIVVSEVKDADGDALRVAVEDLKGRLGSGVILLGSDVDGKVSLVAGVTKDLAGKISAGSVVKAACDAIGGRGGGKPELAMGGGAGDVSGALAAGKGAIAA